MFGDFFRRTSPGISVVSTYFIGMYSTVIARRDLIDSFENCLTRAAARRIASLSYFVAVCFVLSIKTPCGLEKPFPTWNHSAFWFVFLYVKQEPDFVLVFFQRKLCICRWMLPCTCIMYYVLVCICIHLILFISIFYFFIIFSKHIYISK